MKNILISCWLDSGIQILIPKKRGDGFLKVPAGHHAEPWLQEIEYDVFGLEGYLDIDCDCHPWEEDKRDLIINDIMPIITKRFPFAWEVIHGTEFAELVR